MSTNPLIKPIITEKSMKLAESGQFAFFVSLSSTKSSLKKVVSEFFKVDVQKVRILKLKGKSKSSGKKRLKTITSTRKKAIITLKPGQTIDYFKLPEEKTTKKSSTTKAKPSLQQKPTSKKFSLLSRIKKRGDK